MVSIKILRILIDNLKYGCTLCAPARVVELNFKLILNIERYSKYIISNLKSQLSFAYIKEQIL